MARLHLLSSVYPRVLAQIINDYTAESLYIVDIRDEENRLTLSYYDTDWHLFLDFDSSIQTPTNMKVFNQYMYYIHLYDEEIVCYDLLLRQLISLPSPPRNTFYIGLSEINGTLFMLAGVSISVMLYRLVDAAWVECICWRPLVADSYDLQVSDQCIYVDVSTRRDRILYEYNTVTGVWKKLTLPRCVSKCYVVGVLNNTPYVIGTTSQDHVYTLTNGKFIKQHPIKLSGTITGVYGFNNTIHLTVDTSDSVKTWLQYNPSTHQTSATLINGIDLTLTDF